MQERPTKRRAIAPTNDESIRKCEAMGVFGEQESERRARLLDVEEDSTSRDETEEESGAGEYPFYTEGPRELREARIDVISKFSLRRASLRLRRAEQRSYGSEEEEMDRSLKRAEGIVLDSSIFVDDRPLSGCSFSRDGKTLATCSLSGVAKLWEMPRVTDEIAVLKGHTERATDVVFSPVDDRCLATASADRTAKLWKTDGTLLQTFEGHSDRLARIAFHPSGKYLGTTSYDKTWRLWDVSSGTGLLSQEGHSREVYGIAFHHDGSLAASCWRDSVVRVWDLRTGRSILPLEGHIKKVLGASFSPNGYHLASCGEDSTCRIWDLRMRKSLYTIPAATHSKLVSQVKFEPHEGHFLVTASHDMKVRIWSGRDFKLVKTLSGHEAIVTSLDITADASHIASVSHDRTIKLWTRSCNEGETMDAEDDYKCN